MSGPSRAAAEIPASLEAVAETQTPYGGRLQVWSAVATVWVELSLAPLREATSPDRPPDLAQAATATARDHPAAAVGQRLVPPGEPPFLVREVRRGEPSPGRMTLALDRPI